MLFAKADDPVDQYAAARLAEIGNRDSQALTAYLRLYRNSPGSAVLADRIYASAIRAGDMAAAVRTIRAHAARGESTDEVQLVLFADAFRQNKMAMAALAADGLSAGSNFGFMAPMLKAWVDVAEGRSYALPDAKEGGDLFAYFAGEQRVYLQLATGEVGKAKLGLREIAMTGSDAVRDLFVHAAPIVAKSGDSAFAAALVSTALGSEYSGIKPGPEKLSPERGLAALYGRVAASLLEQNAVEQALAVARSGLWLDPENAPVRLTTAKALAALGQIDAALEMLTDIGPTSPHWVGAVTERVDIAHRSDRSDLAFQTAQDAARQAPENLSVALVLAKMMKRKGDENGAATQFRRMVELADRTDQSARQRANYRLMLADSLDTIGDWPAAKAALEAGISIDPDNAQLLNYLGYTMLVRDEEPARASTLIARAFKLAPDSVAVTDSMGWAHYRKGEIDKAVPLLERAAMATGNYWTINEHLGDAYWLAGRRREARYAWGIALQSAEFAEAARIRYKIDRGFETHPSAP